MCFVAAERGKNSFWGYIYKQGEFIVGEYPLYLRDHNWMGRPDRLVVECLSQKAACRQTMRFACWQPLFTLLLCLFLSFFLPAIGWTKIQSGQCSSCHTMHDSQNGASMKIDSTPNVAGAAECNDCHSSARSSMLRLDCLGCHAQAVDGGDNIIADAPQIAHVGTDLAAGNYHHVFVDDSYGHNIHGFGNDIVAQDSDLQNTPPGYVADYDPSTAKYQPAYSGTAPQVMCAGTNGCHGDREKISQTQAMHATHHGDDSVLKFGSLDEASQGATVATSYRFLNKVHGAEDADWQATTGPTDHNEYKGIVYADRSTQDWADIESISQLCAECHGLFHASADIGGPSSPWIRHPTDILLPNSGEYAAYTSYDLDVPVGRVSITGSTASGTVTPGTDTVLCLSCHRAHGSPFSDMLRWDYTLISAGTTGAGAGNGCFVCHSNKDGV